MRAPATTSQRERLERNLADSIAEALALEQHLKAERLALEGRDADALGVAAGQKQKCVARLEALERERRAAGEQAPEQRQWLRFLAVIGRCNDMNATNGAIIRLRREQVSAALKAVSGAASETCGTTYDIRGVEAASRSGRTLAAI